MQSPPAESNARMWLEYSRTLCLHGIYPVHGSEQQHGATEMQSSAAEYTQSFSKHAAFIATPSKHLLNHRSYFLFLKVDLGANCLTWNEKAFEAQMSSSGRAEAWGCWRGIEVQLTHFAPYYAWAMKYQKAKYMQREPVKSIPFPSWLGMALCSVDDINWRRCAGGWGRPLCQWQRTAEKARHGSWASLRALSCMMRQRNVKLRLYLKSLQKTTCMDDAKHEDSWELFSKFESMHQQVWPLLTWYAAAAACTFQGLPLLFYCIPAEREGRKVCFTLDSAFVLRTEQARQFFKDNYYTPETYLDNDLPSLVVHT